MGRVSSSSESDLLERVVAETNLLAAWTRVRSNHGAPGVDGETIEAFEAGFSHQLASMQSAILSATYRPRPVRSLDVPKDAGGTRTLGIPTVRDRLVLQALSQALAPLWEPGFSPCSFAYRPGRTPQQAVAAAQAILGAGHRWVVDLDIEKFFDNVDHVRLMLRLGRRIADVRVLDLIADFLRTGRTRNGVTFPTRKGIAQGSPLSPLLANIVLDELDGELARRAWPFVRFAHTEAEGLEMVGAVADFLRDRLHLRLHPVKTQVVQPAAADYLGFTYRIGSYGQVRRRVTRQAVVALRERVATLVSRQPGDTFEGVAARVAKHVRGWAAYYGFGQSGVVPAALAWVRQRLRVAAWELWRTPARRQQELERRGVPPDQAARAAWSLHFTDTLGQLPELTRALPDNAFARWGLTVPRVGQGHARPAPSDSGRRSPRASAATDDGLRRFLFARILRRLRIDPAGLRSLRSVPADGRDTAGDAEAGMADGASRPARPSALRPPSTTVSDSAAEAGEDPLDDL
ncbi:MAG: group II intron reverse transcriptase/maturase [Verrucomicrobiales bacterium]|nr:group II intron reverse transcriptase/maturase [Verrucomicrobiales bacterium]